MFLLRENEEVFKSDTNLKLFKPFDLSMSFSYKFKKIK